MQIKPHELTSHLASGLAPVYLISGDEPLIVEESCDAVIQAARQQGFTERSIHYAESGKWHELGQDSASLSLFAEKKMLDVRATAKRLDREASDAIREWLEQADGDQLLLLRSDRLDARQRKSAWFKAIDSAGVISLNWAMSPQDLPRWLNQRARGLSLQLDAGAAQYLVERVEGNLLAAAQELDQLALLESGKTIDVEIMARSLEDASRYNAFDLMDAVMAGDSRRTVRVLAGLRQEGVSLFAILGALNSQIRKADNPRGLPPQRARLLQQFVQRIREPELVLAEAATLDQQGKGQLPGDAWVGLERLMLRLSGLRQVTLPSQDQKVLRG